MAIQLTYFATSQQSKSICLQRTSTAFQITHLTLISKSIKQETYLLAMAINNHVINSSGTNAI